jgi:ABC-type branched-subunit amino acid transport system substrate-binding protein
VKIGFVSGFSGPYAGLGQDQIRGAELALAEVNGQAGGMKIELVQRDDKLNTQEAAKQTQQLIQNDNVKLLVGCISAATTLAMNEVAKRAEALYLGICQTNQLNKMPDFSPYTFHIALTPYMNAQAAGPWIANNLGKKWYFLMPDYAFGKEMYEGLSKALKASGGTELGVTWTPLGTKDFNPYVPKIKEANPEVLIAGSAGGDLVNFLKQAPSFGFDKNMKIFSPVVDLAAEIELGFENVAGTYASANFYWELGDKVPSAKKFAEAYQAKYNVPPSGYSAYSYEAMRLLIDAIAKTGSDDPKKIAGFLEGYKYDYTRGSEWLRKCDHQNIQPVFMLKGRTAQEAATAKKEKFGFREIIATIEAADANERSCQELGLADRQ